MKWVVTGSGLVVGAVAIGACMGTIEDGGGASAPPDRAALVSQKRQWLESFDRHCDACFSAFELCERGAVGVDERDACTVAMEACVRGGMLGPEVDAGRADASTEDDVVVFVDDDDAQVEEADAGVSGDAGDLEGDDAGSEGDGGADDDPDAGLANPDDAEDGGADIDAGADSDGNDDDDDAGLDDRERAKEVLIGEIGVCLDLARSCLEPRGADASQCVTSLGACVQQALEEAFEVVCTEQVRACRAEKQSRANLERVERECRASLLI